MLPRRTPRTSPGPIATCSRGSHRRCAGALGACHALELPFVFGTLHLAGVDRFVGAGPAADALSAEIMDVWSTFDAERVTLVGRPTTPYAGRRWCSAPRAD